MKFLFSILSVLFIINFSYGSKLGSLVVEKCPEWGAISAPCYVRVLDNIISGISQGVPSLGLPPMDPLVVTPVNITVRAGDLNQFSMSFHKMNFTGLSKTRVQGIKVGNPLRLRLHLPKLRMTSPFTNEGRLVLLRTNGGGDVTFTFAGVTMDFELKYDEVLRDGERYAVVEAGGVKVSTTRSHIQLDRLVNNNDLTKELLNVFLGASSDEIINVLLPHINEAFTKAFLNIARQTTANLPLSEVFKPWEEPPSN